MYEHLKILIKRLPLSWSKYFPVVLGFSYMRQFLINSKNSFQTNDAVHERIQLQKLRFCLLHQDNASLFKHHNGAEWE